MQVRNHQYRGGGHGKKLSFVLALLLVSAAPMSVWGDEPQGIPDTLIEDELLIFEDMPTVISAARQSQPINLSAVPISVITAEDIHYSGLTNIPELLRFVPGVDVLQIDNNRYAIGIRGLHSAFNDRTLTLINGRSAGSPVFGGTDFLRLPVFMEDIERIEVVRGPGGAAWGPNAFNGVINIITKKPKDVQGFLLTSTIDEFGSSYSQARWGAQRGDWSWRVSAGWQEVDSNDETLDSTNPLFPDDTFTSHDFRRTGRIDTEAVYQASSDTRITFGVGYAGSERGDFEFFGFYPMENEDLHTLRTFARIDHDFDNKANGYIQWFTNVEDVDGPSQLAYESYENDLEIQYSRPFGNDHDFTIGGNLRWNHINTKENHPQDLRFPDNPFDDFWAGAFVMDRWKATDRLTLEGQLRVDYYSETETDWSGRATALYALDQQKHHVLRVSGAKAFRAPLAAFRELVATRSPLPGPPFGPGGFAITLMGDEEIDNEQIWAIETGYTGRLSERLTVRVDGYFNWYQDMVGARDVSPAPVGPQTFVLDNLDGGRAWGVETEIAWKGDGWQAGVWYAYNDFEPEQPMQEIRAFQPARHKAGLSFRCDLPMQSTFNVNYRYTDTTPSSPGSGMDAPMTHRLDLTVAKQVFDGRGEVMLGVTDLLDSTDDAVLGVGAFSQHETQGRAAFARVQLTF